MPSTIVKERHFSTFRSIRRARPAGSESLLPIDFDALSMDSDQYQGVLAQLLESILETDKRTKSGTSEAKQMRLVDVVASFLRALLGDLKDTHANTINSVVHVITAYTSALLQRMLQDSTAIAALSKNQIHFLTTLAAFVLAYSHRTTVTQDSNFLVLTSDSKVYYASVVERLPDEGTLFHTLVKDNREAEKGHYSAGESALTTDVEKCVALALQAANTNPLITIIVAQAFENRTLFI
ncbi:hypothetical protein LTR56_027476, partial [Elasticomyces elasticus]